MYIQIYQTLNCFHNTYHCIKDIVWLEQAHTNISIRSRTESMKWMEIMKDLSANYIRDKKILSEFFIRLNLNRCSYLVTCTHWNSWNTYKLIWPHRCQERKRTWLTSNCHLLKLVKHNITTWKKLKFDKFISNIFHNPTYAFENTSNGSRACFDRLIFGVLKSK